MTSTRKDGPRTTNARVQPEPDVPGRSCKTCNISLSPLQAAVNFRPGGTASKPQLAVPFPMGRTNILCAHNTFAVGRSLAQNPESLCLCVSACGAEALVGPAELRLGRREFGRTGLRHGVMYRDTDIGPTPASDNGPRRFAEPIPEGPIEIVYRGETQPFRHGSDNSSAWRVFRQQAEGAM